MTLRFQPYVSPETYLAYRDAAERRPDYLGKINQLAQTIGGIGSDMQARRRQQLLDELTKQENARKLAAEGRAVLAEGRAQREADFKYGREPGQMEIGLPADQMARSSFIPGGQTQSASPISMSKYRDLFRAVGYPREMAQERPDVLEYLPETERKVYYERFKPEKPMTPYEKKSLALKEKEFAFKEAERAEKKEEEEKRRKILSETERIEYSEISKLINDALESTSYATAGTAQYLSFLKGSPQKDYKELIWSIQSRLGVDKIAEMKAQSRTGATGFGQLSNRELSLLVAAVTNLDPDQSPERIIENLNRAHRHYNNWLRLQEGNPVYSENNPAVITNEREYSELPNGMYFTWDGELLMKGGR